MITHDVTIVEKQQESTPIDISSLKPLPETLPNIVKDLTPPMPSLDAPAPLAKKGFLRQITDMLGLTRQTN